MSETFPEPVQDNNISVVTDDGRPQADENGIFTLHVGSHVVHAKKLTGAEVRACNRVSNSTTDLDRATDRALFAVRDIDKEAFISPKTPQEAAVRFDQIASRFDANEYDLYLLAYADANRDPGLEERSKNLLERLRSASP